MCLARASVEKVSHKNMQSYSSLHKSAYTQTQKWALIHTKTYTRTQMIMHTRAQAHTHTYNNTHALTHTKTPTHTPNWRNKQNQCEQEVPKSHRTRHYQNPCRMTETGDLKHSLRGNYSLWNGIFLLIGCVVLLPLNTNSCHNVDNSNALRHSWILNSYHNNGCVVAVMLPSVCSIDLYVVPGLCVRVSRSLEMAEYSKLRDWGWGWWPGGGRSQVGSS